MQAWLLWEGEEGPPPEAQEDKGCPARGTDGSLVWRGAYQRHSEACSGLTLGFRAVPPPQHSRSPPRGSPAKKRQSQGDGAQGLSLPTSPHTRLRKWAGCSSCLSRLRTGQRPQCSPADGQPGGPECVGLQPGCLSVCPSFLPPGVACPQDPALWPH